MDFILHMFIRYYELHGTKKERVVESLASMGSSILLGGFSTFLGVLLLAFSVSFSFQILFRSFFGMVVLGVSYGLILVPVVLSLIGPEDSLATVTPETSLDSINQAMEEEEDVEEDQSQSPSAEAAEESDVSGSFRKRPPSVYSC